MAAIANAPWTYSLRQQTSAEAQRADFRQKLAENYKTLTFLSQGESEFQQHLKEAEVAQLASAVEEAAWSTAQRMADPGEQMTVYSSEANRRLEDLVRQHCGGLVRRGARAAALRQRTDGVNRRHSFAGCSTGGGRRLSSDGCSRRHSCEGRARRRSTDGRPAASPMLLAHSPPRRSSNPRPVLEAPQPGSPAWVSPFAGHEPILSPSSAMDCRQAVMRQRNFGEELSSSMTQSLKAGARALSLPTNMDVKQTCAILRTSSIPELMAASLHHLEVNAPLNLQQAASSSLGSVEMPAEGTVWGWLEPNNASLPVIPLSGAGVAIGRSREAFETRRQPSARTSAHPHDNCAHRRLAEARAASLAFAEVVDGRISRLHCTIRMEPGLRLPLAAGRSYAAIVEDQSSNGTFVNGERIPPCVAIGLKEGDRVSLVMSITPLIEQTFTLRTSKPSCELEGQWTMPTAALPSMQSAPPSSPFTAQIQWQQAASPAAGSPPNPMHLQRSSTSRYTTAETSEPADLICQICLGPLRSCLALKPCGHNFCASCLSHYFAALLQGGQPLSCPLRCGKPERIMPNFAMRELLAHSRSLRAPAPPPPTRASSTQLSHDNSLQRAMDMAAGLLRSDGSERSVSPAQTERICDFDEEEEIVGRLEGYASEEEEDELTEMSSLCPLYDELLPVEASQLKTKQVELALLELQQDNPEFVMAALEATARLAWSDDDVRAAVAVLGGVKTIVDLMTRWREEVGVQCNACLALMSLLRGEGTICRENQNLVYQAGGVAAVVRAMAAEPAHAILQLSALLCIIPLALDNTKLQGAVNEAALPVVLAAMENHADHGEIMAKALVVLGVVGQGEEEVHDEVRRQQLDAGATQRIHRVLKTWGSSSEEILWAALYALAVLVRDGDRPFRPAVTAVARAGFLPLLRSVLSEYQSAVGQADEMIVTAGEYLIQTLKLSTAAYRDAAQHKVKQSIGVAAGFATAWAAVHWRRFAGQGSA